MKLHNTIAIALWGICSGSAFVCASGDIYADYTVNEPAAVAMPAKKEDPAMQHWVNRFADACALMMGGEKKQSATSAEIFCDLLEEQPDSDDALYLLDQAVQDEPDLKKKIAERIWNIAEKHPGSPTVTGYAALLGYELKHRARFCQFLPVAIRAVTAKPLKQEDGKTAQARLLVLLNAVHAALENQIHGLGPEIQNLYKSDPVLFQGQMATLDLVLFLEACMQ
ncbi:MAG: hypothetical protein J6Q65_02715, partial [Lentisphaeria bacterium]|nr:hypothetical protein [Lentisphaeria bacterium]